MPRHNQTPEDIKETLQDRFKECYGIDAGTAAVLFNNMALKTMLEHMYRETMEGLLECPNLAVDGPRIQGQAQLLNTLLEIPKEIEQIQTANDLD
jgi:hypothetical protein